MIRINLLPVEEAERAAERRTNLALGSLVLGIAVFLFVVAHVWQTARFASTNRRLRHVNAEIAALAGPYADVTRMEQQKKELSEKLRVISQLEAKKVGPVRVLAGLSEATPDKLWLTDYTDNGGRLKLTGFGVDEQTVADFLRRLGVMPVFQSVDLDETSQVTQEGVKLKQFVISGQIDYGTPAGPAQTASGRAPGGAGVAR